MGVENPFMFRPILDYFLGPGLLHSILNKLKCECRTYPSILRLWLFQSLRSGRTGGRKFPSSVCPERRCVAPKSKDEGKMKAKIIGMG